MYGRIVREAVLQVGDHESGVTIHLVEQEYDQRQIVAQAKVPVIT